MNIDHYKTKLDKAAESIRSAPSLGFLNLDSIAETLSETSQVITDIKPGYELGLRLIDDLKAELSAKIATLDDAGSGVILTEARQLIESNSHDYDRLTALKRELDESLGRAFAGKTLNNNKQFELAANRSCKPDDYS